MTTPFQTTVPSVTVITSTGVALQWGAPAPAVTILDKRFLYYQIYVSYLTGPPFIQEYQITDIQQNNIGVSGFTPGALYTFNIVATYEDLLGIDAPGTPIHFNTLPGEVTNIQTDVGSTSARLDWTAGEGATDFVITANGSLLAPPTPVAVQGNQTYTWASGLTAGTTYYGLIRSTADDANFTIGVAFSFTTAAASGPTTMIQLSSTTNSVTVQVTPSSSLNTITCPGSSSITPTTVGAGAGPTNVVISGLSAGSAYTVTASYGGTNVTQPVLTQPPAPASITLNSPDSATAVISYTNAITAGTPYTQITAVPNIGIQYLAATSPATVTDLTPGVAYTFSVLFGQDAIGGSEGGVSTVAMRSAIITSVNGSNFYYTLVGSPAIPTLEFSLSNFGAALLSIPLTGPSPYTLNTVQKRTFSSGTTYYARITASSGQVLSTVFPFEAHMSGFSTTWFFSP